MCVPPQSIGELPNIAPTAPYRLDGNCPKEGVDSALITNCLNSITSVNSSWPPSTSPPAIRNPPTIKWKQKPWW